MGDSNAVRLNGNITTSGVNREGAQTGEIKQQAQNYQRAAQPAVAARPQQNNAGFQRMSNNTTTQTRQQGGRVSPRETAAPRINRGGGSNQQQSGSGGTGGVVQWLHGNPNRPGYDRGGHGLQSNAHDHFSFETRAQAITAFNALKQAGYSPYEFEGFTSVGNHAPGGGHFGPVGASPTYGDTSDGVAFDVPWSTSPYAGSGPIGETDYAASDKAAQIVGALGGGGNVSSGGTTPSGGNSGSGNTSGGNMQPAKPQGNPEDFFAFAAGAQGLEYQAPPGASTTPDNIMRTSAQTTMASNKPAVTVVNTPVSNTSVTGGGGGGQQVYGGSTAGGPISDAGLLAYMAQQQLMTIGA